MAKSKIRTVNECSVVLVTTNDAYGVIVEDHFHDMDCDNCDALEDILTNEITSLNFTPEQNTLTLEYIVCNIDLLPLFALSGISKQLERFAK